MPALALFIADACATTTSSTGSPFTLGTTPPVGCRTPQTAGIQIGQPMEARIATVDSSGNETGDWEVGLYLYSATNTLQRIRVYSSSNSNGAVAFSAGTRRISLVSTAARDRTPVDGYKGFLTGEAASAAKATTTSSICDWIQTLSSDGLGGGFHQDHSSKQRGLMVRMADDTLFMVYTENVGGATTLRVLRSPTGGPDGTTSWTQVDQITTGYHSKCILMRDRSRNHAILVWLQGTTSFAVTLRAYDTAGTTLATGSINTAGSGFAQTLSQGGGYIDAGISPTGAIVIAGWTEMLTSAYQDNTTLQSFKQVQWVDWNGTSFVKDQLVRWFTGPRADYDQVCVGQHGDPDQVYGIAQGNVASWEQRHPLTNEKLQYQRIGQIYAFDRIWIWGHNRRTGERFAEVMTVPLPHAVRPIDGGGGDYTQSNDVPTCLQRQVAVHPITGDWWIPYFYKHPKAYVTSASLVGSITGDTLTVTSATASITVGTWLSTYSGSSGKNLWDPVQVLQQLSGTTGGVGTYRVSMPITVASGTFGFTNGGAPSTSTAPDNSYRVMIVSPRGEIQWDGDVLPSLGFGYVSCQAVSNGKMFLTYTGLGPSQTQFHIWELVRNSDGGISTLTKASTNHLNSNNLPTGNVGFGTNGTYLSGATTTPYRNVNMGPIFPDLHLGSKVTTNHFDILISRNANDLGASGADDTTSHKMDLMRVRVPIV